MPEYAEADLRRFYGYPEDMTYEQFAKQERDRAVSLLPTDADAAVEILVRMTNSIVGDPEACMLLGDIYSEGRYMRKDPWKAMLYYVSSMTDDGDRKSKAIWDRLAGFRAMLLNSRPLGRLAMNNQEAEYACCDKMLAYMTEGSVSVSNDDPEDLEFSITMSKADFKKYLGKEKHEVLGSTLPGTVTPMDLTCCPFCKARFSLIDRTPEWDQLIDNAF